MPDVVDAATRSRMMSGIRAKNTQPELRVRRRLHAAGLRYRIHAKNLPGKPDLVFAGANTVLFVHGCFWHQHLGCHYAASPKSNREFWQAKLQRNVERDRGVCKKLRTMGWKVETLWECQSDSDIDELADRMKQRYRA